MPCGAAPHRVPARPPPNGRPRRRPRPTAPRRGRSPRRAGPGVSPVERNRARPARARSLRPRTALRPPGREAAARRRGHRRVVDPGGPGTARGPGVHVRQRPDRLTGTGRPVPRRPGEGIPRGTPALRVPGGPGLPDTGAGTAVGRGVAALGTSPAWASHTRTCRCRSGGGRGTRLHGPRGVDRVDHAALRDGDHAVGTAAGDRHHALLPPPHPPLTGAHGRRSRTSVHSLSRTFVGPEGTRRINWSR